MFDDQDIEIYVNCLAHVKYEYDFQGNLVSYNITPSSLKELLNDVYAEGFNEGFLQSDSQVEGDYYPGLDPKE